MKCLALALILVVSNHCFATSLKQMSVLDSKSVMDALESMGVKPDPMGTLHHVENVNCKSFQFEGPALFTAGRRPFFEFWGCVLTDTQQHAGGVTLKSGTVDASLLVQAVERTAPSLITGPLYNRQLKVASIVCIGKPKLVNGNGTEVSPNCTVEIP